MSGEAAVQDACETWHSFDGISLPLIREFAEHWNAIRGDRAMPARQDFDPLEAKRFLPHIFLPDVIRPEMRFRGRLVGTAIVETLGFDYTGRCLDEVISEPYLSTLQEDLTEVAETGVSHYRVTTLAWEQRDHAIYHRLYLPMTTDSDRVDLIVGIARIVNWEDQTVQKDPIAAIIENPGTQTARIVLQR